MAAGQDFQSEFRILGQELKALIETRLAMLRAELSETVARVRSATILLLAATVFGVTSMIMLGFCVSLAIALGFGAFHNQAGVVWGFLVTGGTGLVIAAILGNLGVSRVKGHDLRPRRTMRVLERDGEAIRQGGETYGDESTRRRSA